MGWEHNNGCCTKSFMDVETGDITVVHDFPGCSNGSVFHIPGKKKCF